MPTPERWYLDAKAALERENAPKPPRIPQNAHESPNIALVRRGPVIWDDDAGFVGRWEPEE